MTTKTTGNPSKKYSFKKEERLTGRKSINFLFESGRRIESYPLKILYRIVEGGPYPAEMAVSVPKRLFKRAVDRNLLKRRIREAYRAQKPEIYSSLNEMNVHIHLVIQYRNQDIQDFQAIAKCLKLATKQLMMRLLQETSE